MKASRIDVSWRGIYQDTYQVNPNVPIGSIQRILGHEYRSTTELYLHSIGDSEREAMDVLNARFETFSHIDSHINKKGDMTE